ncbi:hypothetical protein MKW94_022346 [Papaver nudicaule]|uniref:Uncharacterized protein n=1 Tax=Papaver nudicaule TaxID=74823 RepID=A0AA41VD92_PAPNU|nr:hypothetical protein [Papaver nudicaule]
MSSSEDGGFHIPFVSDVIKEGEQMKIPFCYDMEEGEEVKIPAVSEMVKEGEQLKIPFISDRSSTQPAGEEGHNECFVAFVGSAGLSVVVAVLTVND